MLIFFLKYPTSLSGIYHINYLWSLICVCTKFFMHRHNVGKFFSLSQFFFIEKWINKPWDSQIFWNKKENIFISHWQSKKTFSRGSENPQMIKYLFLQQKYLFVPKVESEAISKININNKNIWCYEYTFVYSQKSNHLINSSTYVSITNCSSSGGT